MILLTCNWHRKYHAGFEPSGHFCMDYVATVKFDGDVLSRVGPFRNRDLHHSIADRNRLVRISLLLIIGFR